MEGGQQALYPFSRAWTAERQRARAIEEEERVAEAGRKARTEIIAARIKQESATIRAEIKTEIKVETKSEEGVIKEEDPNVQAEEAARIGNGTAELEKEERFAVKEVALTTEVIDLTFSDDDDELRNNNNKVNTPATRLLAVPSPGENTPTSRQETAEAEWDCPGAKCAPQISAPEGSSSSRVSLPTPSESTSLKPACPGKVPAELPAELPSKTNSLLRLKRSCHATTRNQGPKRLKLHREKIWFENFEEGQRNPVRHVAKRTRPPPRKITKKPKSPPRLCRGRIYKPRRDIYGIESTETSPQRAEEVVSQVSKMMNT